MSTERAWWLGLLPGIGAALIPKCPACLVAYLSFAGLGLGAAASIAPLLRPIGLSIAALSLVVILARRMRRRPTRSSYGDDEDEGWNADFL